VRRDGKPKTKREITKETTWTKDKSITPEERGNLDWAIALARGLFGVQVVGDVKQTVRSSAGSRQRYRRATRSSRSISRPRRGPRPTTGHFPTSGTQPSPRITFSGSR